MVDYLFCLSCIYPITCAIRVKNLIIVASYEDMEKIVIILNGSQGGSCV